MSNFAFDSFDQIINMDGHGLYVWLVFLIFLFSITTSFIVFNSLIKKYKSQIRWNNIEKRDY